MIDVTHQISAVDRRVGARVLAAGEARTVEISQEYDATVDEVWDACTNAERIPRWFLPISGELKEGGHYKLEGNAEGTIERCDPPHGFDATWEYGGEVSWIEVRFSAEGDARTRLLLTHIAHVDDERWAEFGPAAVGIGWDLAMIGLSLHLASGSRGRPGRVRRLERLGRRPSVRAAQRRGLAGRPHCVGPRSGRRGRGGGCQHDRGLHRTARGGRRG
jgi:uncharacterized protein YndB with AHSA1/START domain